MTVTPEHPAQPGVHRHRQAPRRTPAVTHLLFTADMPDGEGARASAGGKVIFVNSSWGRADRRDAVRAELRRFHRFPGLLVWPVLAGDRIRRAVYGAADWITAVAQHGGTLAANNPIVATVAAVAIVAGGTAGGVATGLVPVAPFTSALHAAGIPAGPPPPVYAHLPHYPASYLGVYEATSPGSYDGVEQFGRLVGHQPNLAQYYIGWGEPFHEQFAETAALHGTTPVVQLNPYGVTLASIAAGQDDGYLISYAQEIHAWGKNVVISFGHEMNGTWYPWGYGHVKPAVYVAAWQHIVDVFRAEGDYNVTWLWTVNVNTKGGGTGPISDWWPGSQYVTWVGLDGYYYTATDTFNSIFGSTIADIRSFTSAPILIAETASDPPEKPEAKQIAGLFSGIRRKQILGFIWYDETGHRGAHWRLEGNIPATEAFRHAARGYGR